MSLVLALAVLPMLGTAGEAHAASDYARVVEIPIFKNVAHAEGSESAPEDAIFEFEIVELSSTNPVNYDVIENTVETSGIGLYEGKFAIGLKDSESLYNFLEGVVIREVDSGLKGWTYDKSEWKLSFVFEGTEWTGHINYANLTAGDSPVYGEKDTKYAGISFENLYKGEGEESPKYTTLPNNPSPGGSEIIAKTLSFDPNGGESFATPEEYPAGSVVPLEPIATKEGYTFVGWEDADTGEVVTEVKLDENKLVKARYKKTTVPSMLRESPHDAYVKGYEGGIVKPGNNITRAEVTMIFYRLLKDEVREANHSLENSFNDVAEGSWFNEAVSTMAKLGIIKGRSDTVFDPNAPITRAEYAAICARFDESETIDRHEFNDITGHWAEKLIAKAVILGWVKGYSDMSFKPANPITRAEAMTLTNRVLQRLPKSTDDLLPGMQAFSDNANPSAWYYLAVQEAANSHESDIAEDGHEHWTELREVSI